MELPATPRLIERLEDTMAEAHREWADADRRTAATGTQALKRRIWEMGLGYLFVIPTANSLGDDAAAVADERLSQRGASAWGSSPHSTLGEFQYDVAWAEYEAEFDGHTLPRFSRLVLALESEFGDEGAVLFDFHKLLCARAELRVMVWDADRVRGHANDAG